jgi:EAL domain-containing protein (putative c-di-GMP-specific phosphodiesterase class I)
VHYSVNLSAKSIGDKSLLKLIRHELENHEMDARRVVFEVTETGAIANLHAAALFLQELREMGFRTALDDFGVGYSSFAYLKDLPVDYVKIDGGGCQASCRLQVY